MKLKLILTLMLIPIILSSLTLDECLDEAIKNNKTLKIGREEIKLRSNQYNEVKGTLLPQISGSMGYLYKHNILPESKVMDLPSLTGTVTNIDGYSVQDSIIAYSLDNLGQSLMPADEYDEHSINAKLKMDQVVFAGGKLIKGIKIAGKLKNIQEKQYKIDKEEVIISIKQKFYSTILARKVYEINRQALKLANEHKLRVENMYDNGLVSEYDYLRADLEVKKMQPKVVEAKKNYDLAKESLANDIGYDKDDLNLEDNFDFNPLNLKLLEEYKKTAKTNRIEYELLNLSEEVRYTDLKIKKGNYLPNIGISAEINTFMQEDSFELKSENFGSSYQIGIGFEIPIFTGFSNYSKMKGAENELRKTQLSNKRSEELIELQIENSFLDYQASLENLEAVKSNVSLANRGLKIAQKRYENNIGIQLEVFDAQIQKKQAMLELNNALYKAIMAKENLKKSIGKYSK